MKLVIDQDRARAFGVSSERIRQVLQASLSGAPIGDFREGEETVSIVLRQPDAERTLLSAVEFDLRADRSRRRGAGLATRQGRAGA